LSFQQYFHKESASATFNNKRYVYCSLTYMLIPQLAGDPNSSFQTNAPPSQREFLEGLRG